MRLTMLLVTLSTVLVLTGCQTTKRLALIDVSVVCAALRKGEPIQYLSADDIALVRQKFTTRGKDGQKMVKAIMKELGC